MKKLSKRKRRLQRQREAERLKGRSGPSHSAACPVDNAPLEGMRIKRVHVFIPEQIGDEWISPSTNGHGAGEYGQIVFKPQAVSQLKRLIGWGKHTEANGIEQQGLLLGQVYQTSSGYLGVVEQVLLSGAVGTEVYVESSYSQWFEMERQLDALNEGRTRKLVKVGWWHTHPNMSVFMSGTDLGTQSRYFYEDWQFAVVLNPQGRKWAAFIGEQATSCAGYFLNHNLFKPKKGGARP